MPPLALETAKPEKTVNGGECRAVEREKTPAALFRGIVARMVGAAGGTRESGHTMTWRSETPTTFAD
jgi:hypothetical protein